MRAQHWSEISKLNIKASKIFQMIKDLKRINALEFNGEKYTTASNVQEYLK